MDSQRCARDAPAPERVPRTEQLPGRLDHKNSFRLRKRQAFWSQLIRLRVAARRCSGSLERVRE